MKKLIEELHTFAHRERLPFDPLWESEARRLIFDAADVLASADKSMRFMDATINKIKGGANDQLINPEQAIQIYNAEARYIISHPNMLVTQQALREIIGAQLTELLKLRVAIRLTIEENGHLADGENCTLSHLKKAIGDE